MHELVKSDYNKVIPIIKSVEFNYMFAYSVVKKDVKGKVFVDNVDNPKVVYIRHPYGMSLLTGDHSNEVLNNEILDFITGKEFPETWMQVYPNKWEDIVSFYIKNNCGSHFEICSRVNFKFNIDKYAIGRNKNNINKYELKRFDRKTFDSMKGIVIPSKFWDSYNDINNKGISFVLMDNKETASVIFSSFVQDKKIEIGIETRRKFRGKGYAKILCSKIIEYCIENNYEPIWSCKLENINSYNLAKKMGFDEVLRFPYYGINIKKI